MAKKTSAYRFSFDAPVVLSLVIASTLILTLDSLVLKGTLISTAFTCKALRPSSGAAFDFKNGLDYLRMISHILGSPDWESLLLNSAFLLLLGPTLEERYGSTMLLIMILATALVSGVLLVTLGNGGEAGSSCIVFMMILLSAITAISRKDIQFSWILTFILYTAYRMVAATKSFKAPSADFSAFIKFIQHNLPTFIDLVSGLVGSLFGFLVAPKKRTSTKTKPAAQKTQRQAKASQSDESYSDYGYPDPTLAQKIDSQSPRYRKNTSSEEEIVGSIDL